MLASLRSKDIGDRLHSSIDRLHVLQQQQQQQTRTEYDVNVNVNVTIHPSIMIVMYCRLWWTTS